MHSWWFFLSFLILIWSMKHQNISVQNFTQKTWGLSRSFLQSPFPATDTLGCRVVKKTTQRARIHELRAWISIWSLTAGCSGADNTYSGLSLAGSGHQTCSWIFRFSLGFSGAGEVEGISTLTASGLLGDRVTHFWGLLTWEREREGWGRAT